MNKETYTIELERADADGKRHLCYQGDSGWEMNRLDNGVVILLNETTGTVVEYSPYAWQSVRTENVNLQEDA